MFVRLYFESLIILGYVFRISELNIGENKIFFINKSLCQVIYKSLCLSIVEKADIDL